MSREGQSANTHLKSRYWFIPRLLRRAIRLALHLVRGKCNRGYCPICEQQVYFETLGPWLRDQCYCSECRSIPRWRALMSVLAELYPSWRDLWPAIDPNATPVVAAIPAQTRYAAIISNRPRLSPPPVAPTVSPANLRMGVWFTRACPA